jgi:hypothetical protein
MAWRSAYAAIYIYSDATSPLMFVLVYLPESKLWYPHGSCLKVQRLTFPRCLLVAIWSIKARLYKNDYKTNSMLPGMDVILSH